MRYLGSSTNAFKDASGMTVSLYDPLPIAPRATSFVTVECRGDVALDEVATRQDAYGEGQEASSYRVFDENVVEIFEARLDVGSVCNLRVPL